MGYVCGPIQTSDLSYFFLLLLLLLNLDLLAVAIAS